MCQSATAVLRLVRLRVPFGGVSFEGEMRFGWAHAPISDSLTAYSYYISARTTFHSRHFLSITLFLYGDTPWTAHLGAKYAPGRLVSFLSDSAAFALWRDGYGCSFVHLFAVKRAAFCMGLRACYGKKEYTVRFWIVRRPAESALDGREQRPGQ